MRSVTFLFLFSWSTWITAQNYAISSYTGDDTGYESSSTQYTFITVGDSLSVPQTLPFAFDFYGQSVSSYRVAKAGYITFDAPIARVDGANVVLPNASGPNNAIYALWDDFRDPVIVSATTYGIAPNRVHQITWSGLNYQGGSASQGGFTVSVKLYEGCYDFEVIVQENGIPATSSYHAMINTTIGCENSNGTIGAQLNGSPNYIPSNPDRDQTRYEVHRFSWNTAKANDAALIGLSIDPHLSVGNHTLGGIIRNEGDNVLTTYAISYSLNGGPVQTSTVTGVSLNNTKTHEWTHGTAITMPNANTRYEVKVWVSSANGAVDDHACNDTLTTYVTGINQTTSPKKVLLEEFTGAWCGHCIDGAVIADELKTRHGAKLIPVAIHEGDSMEFDAGIQKAFSVSGYPTGMVDRTPFAGGNENETLGRSDWGIKTRNQLTSFTPVAVDITHQWNPNTRVIDATVTANYSDHSAGDARIVLMVVEDSVRGVGSGWDQSNYYDQTAGHPYFGAGTNIVGYYHRHVLRDYVQSGPFGVDGVIPHFVSGGSSYQHQFQYTLPVNYDPDQVELVAAVVYFSPTNDPMYIGAWGQRTVLNATATHLNTINSVVVLDDENEALSVYPNPTNDQVTVALKGNTEVELLQVYNAAGQLIQSTHGNSLSLGGYPAGIYILEVRNQNKVRRRRIVKMNP